MSRTKVFPLSLWRLCLGALCQTRRGAPAATDRAETAAGLRCLPVAEGERKRTVDNPMVPLPGELGTRGLACITCIGQNELETHGFWGVYIRHGIMSEQGCPGIGGRLNDWLPSRAAAIAEGATAPLAS